jgi:predicted Zn-dependent protease
MRRGLVWWLLALAVAAACATAPVTGRQQLILVPEGQVNDMGARAYQDVLAKSSVVTGTPEAQLVQEVGRGIAAVAPKEGYEWKFSLIRNDQANAFSLPGGAVVVYTGILKYARAPAELAAVIGHEMAHDLANHGAERMSQQLLAQLGATGLQAAVGAQSPAAMQALMAAYGAGTQIGILLPFSRTQESEADRIGLILMARAGYDPRAALRFWQSMTAAAGPRQVPEFLSTHPADEQRLAGLREAMPEALAEWQRGQPQAQAPPQPQAQPSGQGGWVFGAPRP